MSWSLTNRFRPKSTVGQYYPGIVPRSMAVLTAGLLITFTAVSPAGVAQASPPSGDDGTGECSFILTPPKVMQISGMSLVVATLRPGPCTMHANPNSSVVCLSVAGSGSQGECASKNGADPAEVRYPYQPGSTYVLKATGCAGTFEPPYNICQDYGPSQYTL
jgi:hypothetical protein